LLMSQTCTTPLLVPMDRCCPRFDQQTEVT